MTLKEEVLAKLQAHLDRCSYTDMEKIREVLDALALPEEVRDRSGFGDNVTIRVNKGNASCH